MLVYIAVALGFSFLCSVLEAVLLSASPSAIEVAAQQGKKAGLLMRRHKEEVEKPISAILTLNTIAHTIGAAGAGSQAAAVFGNQWLGLSSAGLTFLILFFSEIIPKTIGAVYWKQLIGPAAFLIHWMVIVFYPVVWAGQQVTRLLNPHEGGPTVTRSEIAAMASIGAGEGALEETEHTIFRNLLRLNGIRVKDIMTPRTVLFALPERMTVREVLQEHDSLPYSRIPVYADSVDSITGFVLRHDVLKHGSNGKDNRPLDQLKRPIQQIPELITAARALDEFIQQGEHIFLVFDEYGGTEGIITLEDTIEALLGSEITDESDVVADLRKMALDLHADRQNGTSAVSAPATT
ncbi:MAG: CNNM domain-containing protein [Anaerolineae bacterium]